MSAIQAPPPATVKPDELGSSLRGELLALADPGYDAARRIWNGAIDRRPAYIARCTGVADVVAAVRFARERDLLVAVRSGGHGVGGHALCDGGLVIDLSPMKGIHVDPQRRTARAEAGVLWGQPRPRDPALRACDGGWNREPHGRFGAYPGWRNRLVDAQVRGDGRQPALRRPRHRGWRAGHREREREPRSVLGSARRRRQFGIVTSFEFRLHAIGPIVLAGPIFYPLEDAPEVLRFYRELAAAAPDELTTILELELAPPLAFLPEDMHGKPIVMVGACYAGAPRRRGRGRPACERVRQPDRRSARAKAVPGAAVDARPVGVARLAPLLEVRRATAVGRRGDRHTHRPHLADHVATLVHHHPPARRGDRSRAGGRNRLRPARRRAQRRHQRRLDRRRPRGRPAHRLGARFLRRPAAARARPRLRQLPGRRRARPRPTGLRRREVRPAVGAFHNLQAAWSASTQDADGLSIDALDATVAALARDGRRAAVRVRHAELPESDRGTDVARAGGASCSRPRRATIC